MTSYDTAAVVIGGGITSLGVMRNLGRNGISVYCVVEKKSDLAIYSKYCKGYTICPGIENDQQVLKDFLTKFEKRIAEKAVLFPTSDMSALHVSTLIHTFDKYVVVMPKHEVLETLIVKRKFYESLEKMGIPHPTTLYPDRENFEEAKKMLQYPVFIKPSISPLFAEKFPGKKGFIARSEKELNQYLLLTQKCKIEVIIQEIIQGPYENHYSIDGYFDKNSTPLILFVKHLLWAPTLFDNSNGGISIPISEAPNIISMIVRYLTSINYCGLFNAMFKLDSRDNIFKFFEVNARSWWTNSFPSACGVNIILTAYLEAIGEEVKQKKKYQSGIYNIYLLRDLATIFSKNADLNQRFIFKKRLTGYTGKKHWSDYARDDPKPFLISLSNLINNLKL